MAYRIAVPTAVSAAAAPGIIVVVVTRPRAGEPAFVVPRRHRAPAVILAIAVARTATLVPTATDGLGMPLGVPKPATMSAAAAPIVTVLVIARTRP
jgi:hypothetical protein